MNRRDFLKGMLALAGATALSQIDTTLLANVDNFEPEPEILTSFSPARSYGRLGRIEINGEEYALDDASLTMRRKLRPVHYLVDKMGHVEIESGGKNLIESPWNIDLFVREEKAFDLLERERGEIDFHIDTQYADFYGKGWLESVGVENTTLNWAESGGPLFQITIEGSERLSRYKI